MVGQVGGERFELRIFVGDVAPAARAQLQLAVVGVDQQPVAVPLALESPLRSTVSFATDPWVASIGARSPACGTSAVPSSGAPASSCRRSGSARSGRRSSSPCSVTMTSPPFAGPSGELSGTSRSRRCRSPRRSPCRRRTRPSGSSPSNVAYSSGWSSVCTARWFTDGVSGRFFGTAQRHQHAVAFQPEVVVQAAGVVLLDDERVVRHRQRASTSAPVPASSPCRACCDRSSACPARRPSRRARRADRRRAPRARAPRRSADGAAWGPRAPPTFAARRRSDARVRASNTARWSSSTRCSGSSPEDLAGAQALGHRRGDQLRHRLFQLLGNAFGQHRPRHAS